MNAFINIDSSIDDWILSDPLFDDFSILPDSFAGIDQNNLCDNFESFINDLKSGNVLNDEFVKLRNLFLNQNGLIILFLGPSEKFRVNDVIKLPELLANCYMGKFPDSLSTNIIAKKVIQATALYEYIQWKNNSKNLVILSKLVSGICLNYSSERIESLNAFINLNVKFKSMLEKIIDNLQDTHTKLNVMKIALRHTKSSGDIKILFRNKNQDLISQLLFIRSALSMTNIAHVICYLTYDESFLFEQFIRFLTLWGDPVVARANVSNEIIYFTQIIFLMFIHFEKELILSRRLEVIKVLAKGLPNHYNSTDFRTLNLAKFLSEFIMSTYTYYDDSQKIPEETIYQPQDELSQSTLKLFEDCCYKTKEFWFSKYHKCEIPTIVTEKTTENIEKLTLDDDDDDDDDDLEPIETNDAPLKCNIRYVRDFLEAFPEVKDKYDETVEIFRSISPILSVQLKLDHPTLTLDVLERIYRWENDFEDGNIDLLRNKSLCAIIESVPEISIPKFISYFNGDQTQVHKKSLILQILNESSKNMPLKDLGFLADHVFGSLLKNENSINEQETSIKIPFILFLTRIITLLPEAMVKEQYLTMLMKSIMSIELMDNATRQTIVYSLNNIMGSIGHYSLNNNNVQKNISLTRDWLTKQIAYQ